MRFWDGSIVFQRLARFTTSKPPTSILWYATFDIPTCWCGMPRVLKNCESHNLTLPFLTWKSNNRTSPLLTMLLCQHLAFFLAWARNAHLQWQWPRNPYCEACFPWKNMRSPRTVGRSTCEFTIACERKTHFTWEKKTLAILNTEAKRSAAGLIARSAWATSVNLRWNL